MSSEPSAFFVPIYLNQKVVFDTLAMMEDGFSEFRDVSSSNSEADTKGHRIEASVTAGNILQFVGLALKGGARRDAETSSTSAGQESQRKVHTPASLFYKLRSRLRDGDEPLARRVETLEDLQKLSGGEFVEFRAILQKNPLVELFETLGELVGFGAEVEAAESGQAQQVDMQQALESLFGDLGVADSGLPNAGVQEPSPEQQLAEQDPNYRMIKAFETALTKHGSLEIVGQLPDVPGATAVLSTRIESFEGGDASEIIDGEFWVLGKAVRVVPSEDEGSINLLRKTPFGALKEEEFDELAVDLSKQKKGDSDEGQEEVPVNLPEVKASIKGPAILVLPMAIFV